MKSARRDGSREFVYCGYPSIDRDIQMRFNRTHIERSIYYKELVIWTSEERKPIEHSSPISDRIRFWKYVYIPHSIF